LNDQSACTGGEKAMNIRIRDKKTGKIVADIPVILQGMNYTPTQAQYFDEAWRCAVEDKSVVPDRKSEYEFIAYES
jgi:hypothetical protein